MFAGAIGHFNTWARLQRRVLVETKFFLLWHELSFISTSLRPEARPVLAGLADLGLTPHAVSYAHLRGDGS